MFEYAESAEDGLKVIIAGAGGAAHLPGMIASIPLCQFSVPIATEHLHGQDSLLAIVQMPKGIPVELCHRQCWSCNAITGMQFSKYNQLSP